MACNITLNGITKGCNDNIGGIKTVYFLPFDNLYPAFTPDIVTGKVIGLSYYGDFAKYEFNKQTAQFTTTPQVNDAMDTVIYSTDLVMKFTKLEAVKHQEIYNLCKSDVVAIVVDNNGESWILGGYQSGIVSGGTMTSGVNYADGSGYEITVNFLEYQKVQNPLLNVNFSVVPLAPGNVIRGLISDGSNFSNQCEDINTFVPIVLIKSDLTSETVLADEDSAGGAFGEINILINYSLEALSLTDGNLSGYISLTEFYMQGLNYVDFRGNLFSTAQKNHIIDEIYRVSTMNNGTIYLDSTPSLDVNSPAFKGLAARGWTIVY